MRRKPLDRTAPPAVPVPRVPMRMREWCAQRYPQQFESVQGRKGGAVVQAGAVYKLWEEGGRAHETVKIGNLPDHLAMVYVPECLLTPGAAGGEQWVVPKAIAERVLMRTVRVSGTRADPELCQLLAGEEAAG